MIGRTRALVLLTALAGALGLGVVLAQAPSDYDGVVDITIRNNRTDTAIHGPVPVTIHADNLVDGGYAGSDGSDILFTSSSNAPTGGIAPDMDNNDTTWWWYADANAGASTGVRMFTGGPDADHMFPAGVGATIEVDDDSDFDFTTSMDLSVEFNAAELPETTVPLISKPGAYMLGIDEDGVTGRIGSGQTSSTILRPNGAGDLTELTRESNCSANWRCVDEASADGYDVYTTVSTGKKDSYTLADPTLDFWTAITSVQVRARAKDSKYGRIRAGLRLNGAMAMISAWTHLPSSYSTYTWTIGRPAGGSWRLADLKDLQVVVDLMVSSGTGWRAYCDQVWVVVNYRTPNITVSGGTVEAGKNHTARLALASGTLSLDLDGSQVDTESVTGSILTTGTDLYLGGGVADPATWFRGAIDDVEVGTSATDTKLDLTFESDTITAGSDGTSSNNWVWTGTIDDQTTNDNDATYKITFDTTDVEVDVGPLLLTPNVLPGQVAGESPDLVGDVPLSVFLTTGPAPAPSAGRTFLIGPLADAAEGSGMPAEAWWILVGTMLLGPATALGVRHLQSYTIMAIAGVLGVFVISMIANLGAWWVAFSALWKVGMIGIYQYWRGS